MKLSSCSPTEVTNTATQLSITFESQDSGVCILTKTLSHTKSQSALSSPRSRELKLRKTTQTVTQTSVRTLQSLARLHQLIGTTLTVTKAKSGVWCDYCKSRFGIHSIKGQQQAAWTVHSELPQSHGRKRSYCNDCAIDVSKWADGSYFSLDQQIEYAKTNSNVKQGVLNGF